MTKGQRFTLAGIRYRVEYVNECRAHCVAVVQERRTLTDKTGQARTFTAHRRLTLDIAPTADAATITAVLGAPPGAPRR